MRTQYVMGWMAKVGLASSRPPAESWGAADSEPAGTPRKGAATARLRLARHGGAPQNPGAGHQGAVAQTPLLRRPEADEGKETPGMDSDGLEEGGPSNGGRENRSCPS